MAKKKTKRPKSGAGDGKMGSKRAQPGRPRKRPQDDHGLWYAEMRPIEAIRPYDKNPRLNEAAVEAVIRSIEKFGFRQPIVVDAAGVIIVGHTRWKAARKMGLKAVPVHVAELSAEAARAYRIADNKTASIADWDMALLPEELRALAEADFDMASIGFSDAELASIMGPLGAGEIEEAPVPEVPEEPTTRPGDLWLLGKSRLLCGDATKPADIDRLLAGEKAGMIFTDPHGNVAIGLDLNPRHRQRPGLKNDSLSVDDYAKFLLKAAASFARIAAGDIYCMMGSTTWPILDAALKTAGFHHSSTLIWIKDIFVLGPHKYHSRHEAIWYGWPKGGPSSFCGLRDQDDAWEFERPRRSEEHPTMKPVPLVEKAIRNSSERGGLVADPFAGSGTTLIAAEALGRRAALLEIDPGYCDVIVRRWENHSGAEAVLERKEKRKGKKK